MAKRSKPAIESKSESAEGSKKPGGALRVVTLLLALYGAAMATMAYSKAGAKGGAEPGKDGLDARFAREASAIRTEVQADVRKGIADAREACATEGKKAAVEAANAQKVSESIVGKAEAAAQNSATRSEELEAKVDEATKETTQVKEVVATLTAEVRDLKSRPAAVGPAPAPRDPVAVKPTVPTPTPGPVDPAAPVPLTPEQIAANKAEVRALIADLLSPEIGKVFTACTKLGRLGDLEAVEPLMKVAKEHKDSYARSAALNALGKLHACDAVPVILAAMLEKDASVMLMAGQAFGQISSLDSGLTGDASRKDRNDAKDKWTKWWAQHETEVRERWKQPVGGAPPAPAPAPGAPAVPGAPGGGAPPDAGKPGDPKPEGGK